MEAVGRQLGASATGDGLRGRKYLWHLRLVATTFWVGEVFAPEAADGSQAISAYEGWWYERSGGCNGVIEDGVCQTEPRSAENGFFPSSMTPKQNPFYLDLPFADVNNVAAFALRGQTP